MRGVAFRDTRASEHFSDHFLSKRFPEKTDEISGKSETKFKQVCGRGSAIELFNRIDSHLDDFIELLYDEDVYVHIDSSNAFYYFIISNIVETFALILGNRDKGIRHLDFYYDISDTLYDLIRSDKTWFIKTLVDCGVPGSISTDTMRRFCDNVRERIQGEGGRKQRSYAFARDPEAWYLATRLFNHVARSCACNPGIESECLKLWNNNTHIVDSLADFYWLPVLAWFVPARHVIDYNDVIKAQFDKAFVSEEINNLSWEHSVNSPLIQASDVCVGIYGRFEKWTDKVIDNCVITNYQINPKGIDLEQATKSLFDRCVQERDSIVENYGNNPVQCGVLLRGLQNKTLREMQSIQEAVCKPDVSDAIESATSHMLSSLSKKGRLLIQRFCPVLMRSIAYDERLYRVEESQTTRSLRIEIIRHLAQESI